MTEYGLGTRGLSVDSIGVKQNTPFSRDTGLRGPAGSSAQLATTIQTHIPYFTMNGLRITASAISSSAVYRITPGSVRDFSDTIDLNLGAIGDPPVPFNLGALFTDPDGTGAVVQTQLAGTISGVGTTVTGVGTSFLTDFGSVNGKNNDINIQRSVIAGQNVSYTAPPVISIAGFTDLEVAVASDTSLTTSNGVITPGAGTAYFRGGISVGTSVSSEYYVILLARRDTDGVTSVLASSFTKNGKPDLPVGYTYWRALGYVQILSNGGGGTYSFPFVAQPLLPAPATTLGDMSYFAPQTGLQTRLPVGSSGQFLKVSGSLAPAWSN